MVNIDNLRAWTAELRRTTHPQISGYLGEVVSVGDDGPVIGNCCLGIGCEVAGINPAFSEDPETGGELLYQGDHLFYETGQEYPPPAFHEWLGTDEEGGDDVLIDWPTGEEAYFARGDVFIEMRWSASVLNDELHLTFSQIADVLDYFGVRS